MNHEKHECRRFLCVLCGCPAEEGTGFNLYVRGERVDAGTLHPHCLQAVRRLIDAARARPREA
jgi:hypothetical protein